VTLGKNVAGEADHAIADEGPVGVERMRGKATSREHRVPRVGEVA